MIKLEVYDPPMCCITGICGNGNESTLVTFASDLEWLKKQGVEVIRHGLSFEPNAFVNNDAVNSIVQAGGTECLPIIVVDNSIVSKACYPSREKLAAMCQVEFNDDEAPPIHREENCCCGVDCDCGLKSDGKTDKDSVVENDSSTVPEEDASCCGDGCDCSNAPAEDNCCHFDSDCSYRKTVANDNSKKILFIVIILIIVALVAIKAFL